MRKRNRKFIYDHLLKNPCVDCGEEDPVVLDFDHVGGFKTACLSELIKDYSIARITAEIEQCEVRCANCHRRVTAVPDIYAAKTAPEKIS